MPLSHSIRFDSLWVCVCVYIIIIVNRTESNRCPTIGKLCGYSTIIHSVLNFVVSFGSNEFCRFFLKSTVEQINTLFGYEIGFWRQFIKRWRKKQQQQQRNTVKIKCVVSQSINCVRMFFLVYAICCVRFLVWWCRIVYNQF